MSVSEVQRRLEPLRNYLKVELVERYGSFSLGKPPILICPLCKRPIYDDPEMHEALLSKGKVQGSDYEEFINSRYNCVLLHSYCHRKILGVGGSEVFEELAWYLVGYWTFRKVRDWLVIASKLYKVAGTEALTRFDGVFQVGEKETYGNPK